MSRSSEPDTRPASGEALVPCDHCADRLDQRRTAQRAQHVAKRSFGKPPGADGLVAGEAGLLEGVREGVVSDVVQQRGEPHGQPFALADAGELAALLERGQRTARQVVGAERMLEPGMGGAGVDQESMAELPHIAEALERRRVDRGHGGGFQSDVVPERIANRPRSRS